MIGSGSDSVVDWALDWAPDWVLGWTSGWFDEALGRGLVGDAKETSRGQAVQALSHRRLEMIDAATGEGLGCMKCVCMILEAVRWTLEVVSTWPAENNVQMSDDGVYVTLASGKMTLVTEYARPDVAQSDHVDLLDSQPCRDSSGLLECGNLDFKRLRSSTSFLLCFCSLCPGVLGYNSLPSTRSQSI